jgi:hypothetical protein
MTIWSGAEAGWLAASLSGEQTSFLPLMLMKFLAQTQDDFPFVPRITGAVLFLISVAGFYRIAKPYLGKMVVILTSLVLGAGFLIPVLSKLATLDIWIFAFHFLTFFTLIRFLKQPKIEWRVLFYLLLAISILIQPVSALVFLLGSSTFFWWKHPQGNVVFKLNPWIAGVVLTVVFHFSGLLLWQNDWQIFSFNGADFGKYLLFNFIGVLPFIGFLVGGIRDLVFKLKKGEELAIVITSLLIFSIMAQSPVLQAGLALLIAKQMLLYSDKNYPFKNWVVTTTILHLVSAFILSVFLMLAGMVNFGGIGFRSGLIFSFMYWAIGLIGVFGMYGKQRHMLIGGPVLSGVLTMFIFWVQLYPLLESKRNLPKVIIEKVDIMLEDQQVKKLFIVDSGKGASAIKVYAQEAFHDVQIIESDSSQIMSLWENTSHGILLNTFILSGEDTEGVIKLEGWNDRLEDENWFIHPK